jgi:porin
MVPRQENKQYRLAASLIMSFRKTRIAVTGRLTGTSDGAAQIWSHRSPGGGDEAGPKVAHAIAIMLVAILSSPATAQISEPQEPGTGVPEVPLALPKEPPPQYSWNTHLTGDWGGLRNTLSEKGFQVELGYAMEFMANPVGGIDQGETYVHNVLLSLDFDLERLIGLPNSAFRVRGSQRSGDSLSQDYIGNAFSVQQLFGGGQTWRLVEVEMRHELYDGRLNLAYGRLATTNDFLTSPLYCQFVSNAICGQPPSPFFNLPSGITAYPGATWGALAQVKPTPETYVQLGVYNGDPELGGDNEHGADFSFGDNGVLVISEAGYKPNKGLLDLPAAYKIGGYYHTGDFDEVGNITDGVVVVTPLAPRTRSGNAGVYTLVDQTLYLEEPDSIEGLYGFFVFVAAPDQEKNTLPYFVSAGLIYEGLLNARPQDKAAFAVASGFFSSDLRQAQRNAGLDKQTAETVLELNYQVQVTPYFYVRPDIQYVINPQGNNDIDDAFVIGFEAGLTF